MNKIILMGRLTRDTEINESGKVAINNIAVDRRLRDEDGNKVTDFLNVKWIGERKAQFAFNYLFKGTKILIDGEMHKDQYKDEEGNNKSFYYVLVDNTEFAESKRTGTTQPEMQTQSGTDGFMNIPDGIDDELPFN